MAVKIRLKRMGAKKAPFYRVVVTPETAVSLKSSDTTIPSQIRQL